MAINPNKLSKFWQELKRRRVVHLITVYASAAFVIIELINNLAEPLNLPPKLLTIIVIVLAVGFPLAIILSWIYDLSSEGVEKTKPVEELEENEKTGTPNAWKVATYVSFIVILGLLVFNIAGKGKQLRAGDIRSLVILPFENYTGDDQLDNMVSSMHSLLIGDVGRISGLRVIGKTSSKIYKDTDLSAKDIARELSVDAVMEPTIMCLGDSVCMQFRLVNALGKEELIWVGDFSEDKRQILNLYNRLTRQVADEVKVELTPEEERLLARSRTVNKDAYDAYLKGSYYLEDGSKESLYKAMEYLTNAVTKDPDWAPLYSGLSMVWIAIAQMGYETPEIAGQEIYSNRNKALQLDPDLSDIHKADASMAYLVEWNWEKGEKMFLKALAINPNDAQSRALYGHLLCILQRPAEALTQGQLAIELDPVNPLIQVWYSAMLIGLGDCETAITYMEKLIATDQDHRLANAALEEAAFRCKEYEKSFNAAKNVLPLEEDSIVKIQAIFERQGFVAAFEEIASQLEEAAQNEHISPMDIAMRYIHADQPDKAMDWLEKGFEIRDPTMPYVATGYFNLDPLYDNPRFIHLLERMDLPPPVN